jgi:hypothetical protein
LTYHDYKRHLTIDKLQLDSQWEFHASYTDYWNDQLSETEKKMRNAKRAYEKKKASIELAYRTGKIKTDVKITEGSIKALVIDNPEVNKTLDDYNKLLYEAAKIKGILEAWDDRKRALENEVKLFGMGYFALPNISGNTNYSKKHDDSIASTDEQKEYLRSKRKRRNLDG